MFTGRRYNLPTEMRLLATTVTSHDPVVYGKDSCSIYCPGAGDDPIAANPVTDLE